MKKKPTDHNAYLATGFDIGNGLTKLSLLGPDGRPLDVKNDQTGLAWTPTALFFARGEILFGEQALGMQALNPDAFLPGDQIKLNLANPQWRWKAPDGRSYSALELYKILVERALRLAALQAADQPFAVLPTHPENFPEVARRAVLEAYQASGVKILDPVSEPVAAAYALASTEESFKNAVIIDLGAGTTDITVVLLDDKVLKVLAHAGIAELGGRDFTRLLEDHFISELKKSQGFAPDLANPEHRAFLSEVRTSAERAKITLSSVAEATIVAKPPGGKAFAVRVTRKLFEELARPLTDQVVGLAKGILPEAKIGPADAKWYLVGGGGRIPFIAQRLHAALGAEARVHPEATNAIARGAALLAAERIAEQKLTVVDDEGRRLVGPGIELVGAAPHTLGVLCHHDRPESPLRLTALIRKNEPLPARGEDLFYPVVSMQTVCEFPLAQGEPGALREQCQIIGTLVLTLDPPARLKDAMRVIFKYNRSGMVEVEAIDLRNGRSVRCEIRAPGTPAAA